MTLTIGILLACAFICFILPSIIFEDKEDHLKTTIAIYLSAVVFIFTAMAQKEPTEQENRTTRFYNGEVQQVAKAPDGTILWRVYAGNKVVYFSSKVARWEESHSCGKNQTCTEIFETPNAN